MKVFLQLFTLFLFAFQSFAFEGVLDYSIRSGDRDWEMKCYVKEDFVKLEIYLGNTLYQSILRNEEGLFIADDMSKQVFAADYEQKKWGKTENILDDPDPAEFDVVGDLHEGEYQGKIYSVRHKRHDYYIEIFTGMGEIPGLFLDRFSSLEGIYLDGREVFKQAGGMPLTIYRKKHRKEPILKLVSVVPTEVEDEVFAFPDDYIRAKIRFQMR